MARIYVDSPASVAGGRAIWGLPKEPAAFDRVPGRVTVTGEEGVICSVEHSTAGLTIPTRALAPAFGVLAGRPVWFQGSASARAGFCRYSLEVPPLSPLADWIASRSGRGIRLNRLRMRVPAPRESTARGPESG